MGSSPALVCVHRHKNNAVGREKVAGRHLTLPVGKENLQDLQLTATEGKTRHGSTIQGMYASTKSIIIVMTQRGMCRDSRTINHAFPCMMAQRTKYATLVSNECKPIKQNSQSLSPKSRDKECMLMQCNLSIQARDATCHTQC